MENAQETKAFEVQPTPDDLHAAVMPSVPGHDVQEMVGRGGMGKVYRAKQTELGRTVAVKLLAHEPDEKSLARFREECRAVARLQHSNIAQLYESGLVEGRPFFTQEFLGGGSLAEKFGGQPQDPKDAARIVEIVARAIHFSHQQGILHRDLKPGNILLSNDGTPKVTDFGLAKEIANPNADTPLESSGLTHTGEILGTPSYMAPEQASGVVSKLGPPADIYSLGAILYEALTGRPPFQAPDALQTLFMVLTMDVVSPRVLLPRLPRDIETICLKCLDKTPRRRYASALALAEDLQRFQRGEPIVARPVGKIEQYVKWSKRNKAAAALVAVSVVFFIAMLGAATWVVIGNMRLQKANKDLVDAKSDIEQKAQDLEKANTEIQDTNKNLVVAKNESDESFTLSKGALDEIVKRMSLRLYGVPQAEAVMLDALRNTAEYYRKLTSIRPHDQAVAQGYAEALSLLMTSTDGYGKRQESDEAAVKLTAFLDEQKTKFPDNISLQAINVRIKMQRKIVAERGNNLAAIKTLSEAFIKSVDEFIAKYPDYYEAKSFLIFRYLASGTLAGDKNNYLDRVAEYKKALEIAEKYHKDQPEVPSSFILFSQALTQLGLVEELRNNLLVSREYYERGIKLHEQAAKTAKNPKEHLGGISDMKMQAARITLKLGDGDTAIELYRDAEKNQRELIKLYPLDPQRKLDLCESLSYQALILHKEDLPASKKLMNEAIEILDKLMKDDPKNEQYTWMKDYYRKQLNRIEGKKD